MPATVLMLDVDGVLITGRPRDGKRWDTSLEADLGIDPETLGTAFFAKAWADIVVGKADLLPVLGATLADVAPKISASALVRYWFQQDSRIAPNVLSDLREARARGMRAFLTTNQEHMRADYLMSDLGLADEVDGIVYSAAIGDKKPSKAFFRAAETIVGAPAKELLLVDDTRANVEAARGSGWSAVHWNRTQWLSSILDHHAR